jgi:UDP-2,3-diacylglucosamine pyrophosphatase LpxH
MTNGHTAEPDAKYLAAIHKGLDRAFARASKRPETFDPASERIVVLSDHHKGRGDQADDFRRCEHAYTAALGYYLEAGYRLFVLGDAEELWEEHPKDVLEHYEYALRLEREFADRANGLVRFYGNHDDQWSSEKEVRKYLRAPFGDITVREALLLEVGTSGRIFFVHGHQGTADSDRWRGISRFFVRNVWRPLQHRFGYSATTPARSWELRAKHDQAMYRWARSQRPGLVMIAGHTHRPVFSRCLPDPPPARPIEELEPALAEARERNDAAAAAAVRAELEYARTSARRPVQALQVWPPCYFNTGCCSFPDGDITGLELADGQIRLVRWAGNLREMVQEGKGVDPKRRVLETEELAKVFAAVAHPDPEEAKVVERSVMPL